MSNTKKTTLWILIIAIVAVLGWQYANNMQNENTVPESAAMNDGQGNTAPEPAEVASKTDASDSALVEDSASLDAQLKSLDGDYARADQSLNDKPVDQEI